jgi:hypothetical protein
MATPTAITSIRQKYEALAPLLHEKAQRRWAACEALALGRGGISLVSAATGLSRPTIRRGLAELNNSIPPGTTPKRSSAIALASAAPAPVALA